MRIIKGYNIKGKLIGGKKQWVHEWVDKTSKKIINKAYVEYKPRELNEKDDQTRKACNYFVFK